MEFDLIHFIKTQTDYDDSVVLGINDDAAILNTKTDHQLVVSTDTLVMGRHFDNTTSAQQLGHKSLAVNLSDLAAMGASPKWVTLNLTLPEYDKLWIEGFIKGFLELSRKFGIHLIGGDTTQGPLSITVTALGEVENNMFLARNKAKKGDLIAVTHEIGSAAYALKNPKSQLSSTLHTPIPQLKISNKIKTFAHSCIDISDGLLADLGHICQQSQVAAMISIEQIPVNPTVKKDNPQWIDQVLSGGDDYQLCFTFAAKDINKLPSNCSIIGQIACGTGVKVYKDHQEIEVGNKGFVHFTTISSS